MPEISARNLTKDARESIQYRAMQATFEPEKQALVVAEQALARRAWEHVFSAEVRTAAESMPAGWLRLDPCLRFSVAGQHMELHHREGLPVPHNRGYCSDRLGTIPAGPLADEIMAHVGRAADYKTRRERAARSLKAMLGSVKNLRQLAKLWPEGEPFWKHLNATAAAEPALPAPIIGEINAMLGLAPAAPQPLAPQ